MAIALAACGGVAREPGGQSAGGGSTAGLGGEGGDGGELAGAGGELAGGGQGGEGGGAVCVRVPVERYCEPDPTHPVGAWVCTGGAKPMGPTCEPAAAEGAWCCP